jgi:hypothetical protein
LCFCFVVLEKRKGCFVFSSNTLDLRIPASGHFHYHSHSGSGSGSGSGFWFLVLNLNTQYAYSTIKATGIWHLAIVSLHATPCTVPVLRAGAGAGDL